MGVELGAVRSSDIEEAILDFKSNFNRNFIKNPNWHEKHKTLS